MLVAAVERATRRTIGGPGAGLSPLGLYSWPGESGVQRDCQLAIRDL